MKKILLSTGLILALSVSTSIAATTPTTGTTLVATSSGNMAKHDTAKVAHKQIMSKEAWLSKIAVKRDKVVAAAAKLAAGTEKELVDAALARADRWVKTITGYTDSGTSYGRSAVRAMNELGFAQSVAHHKDSYPTENIARIMAKFDEMKAKAATLTGDMKSAADTMIANTQSVADDLAKHKETGFMSQLVNGLHKEVWALKRFMHMAARKEAAAKTMMPTATPATAMTPTTEKPKAKL